MFDLRFEHSNIRIYNEVPASEVQNEEQIEANHVATNINVIHHDSLNFHILEDARTRWNEDSNYIFGS